MKVTKTMKELGKEKRDLNDAINFLILNPPQKLKAKPDFTFLRLRDMKRIKKMLEE